MPPNQSGTEVHEPLLNGDLGTRTANAIAESHDESGTLTEVGTISTDPEAAAALLHDKHHAPASRVGWGITTAILLADMFGLGALTLPADMARLGWVPGITAILLAGIGMVYTGVLFRRLACNLPRTGRFDEFGSLAFGQAGRWAVYIVVYGAILGEPPVFQITCVELTVCNGDVQSLKQIMATVVGRSTIWSSNLVLGIIVAAIMWPLSQVQGLEEVGWISIFGTVGMLLASSVVLVKLALLPASESTHTYPVERSTSLNEKLVALMDVIFAFGGQINWMRYISAMKYPQHFSRSVRWAALEVRWNSTYVAGSLMMAVFLSTACMGYQKLGNDFDLTVPVTSLLRQDVWSVVANGGVFLHCIIAYQVNLNVWSAMFLNILAPQTLSHPHLLRSKLLWFATNTVGIAVAFLIAYIFPFFSTVLAIVAALGDVGGAYVLPILFNLKLLRNKMPQWEVYLCSVLLPVTGILTVVGLYSSIRVLVQQVQHLGTGHALLVYGLRLAH